MADRPPRYELVSAKSGSSHGSHRTPELAQKRADYIFRKNGDVYTVRQKRPAGQARTRDRAARRRGVR